MITDSLHFSSVSPHGFTQLIFNVMNRIKIINQVLLGLLFVFMSLLIAFQNALFENIYIICFLTKRDALSLSL